MSNTTDAFSSGTSLADALERIGSAIVHVSADQRVASGTVWSAGERLIVTTSRLFHEQRDATLTITTASGRVRGELVGVDETTELALIRAESGDFVDPTWADAARVGLFVAPVARTPNGLRTAFGIVAHVGPAWVTARGGAVDRYLEVDGTLPPGFSGGPLVDFAGTVLGINTRGLMPGGATLPTSTVRRVVEQLAAGGTSAPAHLGVAIQEIVLPEGLRIDPAIARGLLVTGVVADSAAASAGIHIGDTLVAIDGVATSDHAHLLAAMAGKAGATVVVRLVRHGQTLEVAAQPTARTERRGPQGRVWGRGCR
jgi:S1-C subfamily serine protease